MRIRCKKNKLDNFNDVRFEKIINDDYRTPDIQLPLTLGEIYVVYAVEFWDSPYPKFYICDDRYPRMGYPISYYAHFFDILDPKLSKYWILGLRAQEQENTSKQYPIFSFREWAGTPGFFERLIDGGSEEINLFRKYKELIDCEK